MCRYFVFLKNKKRLKIAIDRKCSRHVKAKRRFVHLKWGNFTMKNPVFYCFLRRKKNIYQKTACHAWGAFLRMDVCLIGLLEDKSEVQVWLCWLYRVFSLKIIPKTGHFWPQIGKAKMCLCVEMLKKCKYPAVKYGQFI